MEAIVTKKGFSDWIIAVRRHFHQYPELSGKEFKTQKKIMQELDKLGIENRKIACTGVIGTIKGSMGGKTVALRADMDALKINEEPTDRNASYRSLCPGIMHACGHDGHMAMVLGAASLFEAHKDQLKGNVRVIFQPAEETPPGGAMKVIEEGGMEGVDAILGLHLFPNYESGEICLKEGAMMASHCKFEVTLTGKPGHHFNAGACIDPIVIAADFIVTIRDLIAQALPQSAQYVFEIGTIQGGEQFNQIPEQVKFSGSYRVLDPAHLSVIEQTTRRRLDELMQKYTKVKLEELPKYELTVVHGYPVLYNNPFYTQKAASILKKHFKKVNENISAVLASEDFAYYLQEKPGTFLFLGTRHLQRGLVHELHSSRFDIDEAVLDTGARLLYTLGLDFLENSSEYLHNH